MIRSMNATTNAVDTQTLLSSLHASGQVHTLTLISLLYALGEMAHITYK